MHRTGTNTQNLADWLNRPWLEFLKEKSRHVCRALNRTQRFYFWGLIALVVAGFCYWIFPDKTLVTPILSVPALLLGAGVISDFLSAYKRLWSVVIGKGLILLSYYLATTTAFALAVQILNEIVRYETAGMPYAVSFVAVLLAPMFVFGIMCLILTIALAFGQIYLMFVLNTQKVRANTCLDMLIPKSAESYPRISFLGRAIAFPAVLGFLLHYGQEASPVYEKFVTNSASKFLFYLEATKYSRCDIPSEAKSLKVNDDEIIVVKQTGGSFTFSPQKCRSVLGG